MGTSGLVTFAEISMIDSLVIVDMNLMNCFEINSDFDATH